ncbi:MAG: hypothetical protein FD143_2800 [Ignavibacteria bacterium]|nr:MAG: hypothetical protein FD143_2800 [Ignavibacteria bacterium]KAF0154549.1 MAG: hypothetical protein FD188_3249 [Ignavibacteria bacterium]
MKTKIILSIQILFICIVTISCKNENPVEPPINKTEHYYLHTIDGFTLEKHKQVVSAPDYPLEFKFTRKDSIFRGYIIFENMGARRIDSSCTTGKCFSININYKVVDAIDVSFYTIQFTNDTLKCRAWYSHPTRDYRVNNIIALRINSMRK